MLRSKTAWTVYFFWVVLALAYFIPSPVRVLLRGSTAPLQALRPVMPAIATPEAADTPSVAREQPSSNADAGRAGAAAEQGTRTPSRNRAEKGQPIEDPSRSLAHFAAALARTRTAHTLARVLHFGDSQIDLDHVTSQLRQAFQQRYGQWWPGLRASRSKPWPWFYLTGVVLDASEGWQRLSAFRR